MASLTVSRQHWKEAGADISVRLTPRPMTGDAGVLLILEMGVASDATI